MDITADVLFYSYAREFDLRYVLSDFIILLFWISWLWCAGWKWCLFRGIFIGAICYYIDAVIWYNTPLYHKEDGGTEVQQPSFQRMWEFQCANGVLLVERPPSSYDSSVKCEIFGFFMKPDDAYLMLKGICDFMMTWSYALIWFSWESIVMYLWIESREDVESKGGKKKMKLIYLHSFISFTMNFLVYPISLLIPMGAQVRAIATRHMHNDERNWMIYAAVTNLLLVLYNLTIRRISARDALEDTLFCWTVGCFQAFAMVAPLYLFRIRPVFELSRLLYEVVFLSEYLHYVFPAIISSHNQT
jgi:hypothetical protein